MERADRNDGGRRREEIRKDRSDQYRAQFEARGSEVRESLSAGNFDRRRGQRDRRGISRDWGIIP